MEPLTLATTSIDLRVFQAMPGNSIVLLPNSPTFTIVAATDNYCQTSGRTKEGLVGKGMFEAFPGSPDDPEQGGVQLLRSSLDKVILHKTADRMPSVRYDIENADGSFDERYWSAVNKPILGEKGELLYIIHTAEEMTLQVKAEHSANRIKNLEKSYDLFIQAPVAIGIAKGSNYVIELANDSLLEIWGRTAEEVMGRPLFDAVPDLDGQGYKELLDEVCASGKPFYGYEHPVRLNRHGKEELLYFDFVYKPYYEDDGTKPAGVFTVGHNVTEQVITRQKLEESEGRFRLLADASPNLIWMLKPDGSYGYVNKTTLAFLNTTQEQIAALGWEAFQHPDDLAPAKEALQKAIQLQQPYEMEHRLLHRDGSYRWILSHAIPVYDANGNIFAYVGSSIDIDEAKRNRQKLLTALEQIRLSKEAAELGTFDMDLERGTMHWDDRCRILFGISHHETVTYEKDFAQGLHPDDRERVLKLIERLFVKSISNGDYDVEYRTVGAEDGVIRWVRAKGKVYFDSQDKPVRFIGSVIDITEKMMALQQIEKVVEERTKELAEANERLLQVNKELQRSNQNLEEFAHAASHDLKEPVRKIHFFTQQLREQLTDRLNDSEMRSFSRIENATQRMGNLIDDLLLYSHVSQRPYETELIDMNEKVQRVLEDLDLDIEEKKATIRVGKLPVVRGYRRQLQQLLQNLISNAVKYSKTDEPPVIEIESQEAQREDKHYHLISVKDNGIGFAQEYAAKIFQMFTRLHGKAEYSGTGVGLSIVKKVVENHDGFIDVTSEPGKGSIFKIYLPV